MKIDTKTRVLNEAARLVQMKGFRATRVEEILEAAELRKGGLYHHFLNKEELGLQVLEYKRREFMSFLDESLSGDTPKQALLNFFDAALVKHQKSGFKGGCFFGNTALEMADEAGPFAGAVRKIFNEWTGRLTQVIRAGQTGGTIRKEFSAPVLARQVVVTLEGGIMLARLTKQSASLRNAIQVLRDTLFTKETQ
ncbi:MAG: TetR family transcriptional regulator C-terminal domain-containing protein [Kiritimatiellales bacterium]